MANEQKKTLNLYQKIRSVMKDVEYLQKDNHVSFGKTNYKAISEEKVTTAVRESLIKHGLVIIPIEQDYQRHGNIASVQVKYKIADIDTGAYEIITSVGEGADTQDKAAGKAMTYAYKYMLLRTFAIPTGEDPDKIASAELDQQEAKERKKREKIEQEVNQLIMKLTQLGHNPMHLQQICVQNVGPFNMLSELNMNQLYQVKQLLQSQLQQSNQNFSQTNQQGATNNG